MERQISRLLELSAELYERLPSCGFEDIEAYMTERNIVFAELQKQPASTVDAAVKKQMLQLKEMDKAIVLRMQGIRKQIGFEVEKIQMGKKSRAAYEQYETSYDGDFFDSRR